MWYRHRSFIYFGKIYKIKNLECKLDICFYELVYVPVQALTQIFQACHCCSYGIMSDNCYVYVIVSVHITLSNDYQILICALGQKVLIFYSYV